MKFYLQCATIEHRSSVHLVRSRLMDVAGSEAEPGGRAVADRGHRLGDQRGVVVAVETAAVKPVSVKSVSVETAAVVPAGIAAGVTAGVESVVVEPQPVAAVVPVPADEGGRQPAVAQT